MKAKDGYDVFLCHNSKDKEQVRVLAGALRARGLCVFFDEDTLVPGRPWQEALEKAIEESRAAAILSGPDGIGPWAVREMRAFLDEFVRRSVSVIPVLLPGSPERLELPLFLRQFTWVDLRAGLTGAFSALKAASVSKGALTTGKWDTPFPNPAPAHRTQTDLAPRHDLDRQNDSDLGRRSQSRAHL